MTPLRWLAILYIDVFRATPMLVILILIYYALPFLDIKLSSWESAVLAFSLVMGAYSADGSHIAYVPGFQWEPFWKGYKGGQHSEVWIARL